MAHPAPAHRCTRADRMSVQVAARAPVLVGGAPEMQHGVISHEDRKIARFVGRLEAEAVAVIRDCRRQVEDRKGGDCSMEASGGPAIKARHSSKRRRQPPARSAAAYDRSRGKYVVRWSHDGKRRTKRFDDEAHAQHFFRALESPPIGRPAASPSSQPTTGPLRGDGIYRYETKDGPRWRFVFIQSASWTETSGGSSPPTPTRPPRPGGAPPWSWCPA
jgi:hypothetical protein